MTDYILFDIQDNINITIKTSIKSMCKEKKINYIKQDYKILFSSEKNLITNNEVKFTSGLKDNLSFYGKVYLNKKGKIIENIFLKDDLVKLEPKENQIVIISGGLDNSTFVEIDQELLYFYIAPNNLLEAQKPNLWQSL